MTCYEIVMGLMPFKGQSVAVDAVLRGERPALLEYLHSVVKRYHHEVLAVGSFSKA